jgi:hypothetical protein
VEWSFARDAEILRCEITRADDDTCFRLIVTYPDGSRTIEHIQESPALADRISILLDQLHRDGWEEL